MEEDEEEGVLDIPVKTDRGQRPKHRERTSKPKQASCLSGSRIGTSGLPVDGQHTWRYSALSPRQLLQQLGISLHVVRLAVTTDPGNPGASAMSIMYREA